MSKDSIHIASSAIEALVPQIRALARQEIMERFQEVRFQHKLDHSLVTESDEAMQSQMKTLLLKEFPDFPLLGEEDNEMEQLARLTDSRSSPVWCLDPLDGTTNFANGLPFFAVSLALIHAGQPLLGLVMDPVRDECFTACAGEVRLNNQPLPAMNGESRLADGAVVVDFKRLPAHLGASLIMSPPYRSQRNLGACALEWAWLAAGRFTAYIHGGQKLWDRAAGQYIFESAGGTWSTLEGHRPGMDSLKPTSVVAALDPDIQAALRSDLAKRLAES